MSVLVKAEPADILEKVGDLYLNEINSDVVFIVDSVKLPAHQKILSQRCSIFKAMFPSNKESQKQVVELPETNVEAFKLLLKFIYTDTLDLGAVSINTVFDVASIASTYEVTLLIEHGIDHLKSICAVDNVVDILNKAIKKSHETLVDYCIDYVCAHYAELIVHGNFDKLPNKALYRVLEKPTSDVSDLTFFHAFVGWMKSNPSDSAHFPKLLKQVNLENIRNSDIVGTIRPLNLVDANVLLDLVCEYTDKKLCLVQHELEKILSHALPKLNRTIKVDALTPDSGTGIISGEYPTFYQPLLSTKLKHIIGIDNEPITIDMNNLCLLNYMEFLLPDGDWSYWIEFSKDSINWTRVIDYSKYVCRRMQRLYFQKQILRYIRVCGTAPVGEVFKISSLVTYYTTKEVKVDPETNIVVPSDNVALAENNAVLTQDGAYSPNGMINSATNDYSGHRIGEDPLIVQLPQPYILDSMNLLLVDKHVYDYNIEVSTDKINWTRLLYEEKVTSWRHITFDKQPVVFIKLTGTYSTSSHFLCKQFECPAVTTF